MCDLFVNKYVILSCNTLLFFVILFSSSCHLLLLLVLRILLLLDFLLLNLPLQLLHGEDVQHHQTHRHGQHHPRMAHQETSTVTRLHLCQRQRSTFS